MTGVRAGDTLRMHAEPSARSRVISRIPPDAQGLAALGCAAHPTFAEWQRMTAAEKARSAKARWCKVRHGGTTGWVAGRFLAEGGPPERPSARSVVGPWTVGCEGGACSVEQVGLGGSRRTLLRLEPQPDGNARIIVDAPRLPRSGALTIFMDGEQVSAGPIGPVRSRTGSRIVLDPDDITAGLLRRLPGHKNMVLSWPGEERGVEFHLDDFTEAVGRLRAMPQSGR
ncbi:MAG: hypothetical protein AB7O57_01755 [Hyphomicrobiaceae bacterium]